MTDNFHFHLQIPSKVFVSTDQTCRQTDRHADRQTAFFS